MIRPKKAPFAGSTVDADKTAAQIDKMLREYGCDALQWTKEFDKNLIELRFIVEVEMQGQRRKIGVKLSPPLFMEKRRTWDSVKGRHVIHEAPNFSQSMRVLYWYLKAKLAAVAYGVRPFEEEFLAEIIVPTEEGERRLVDIIKDRSPQMLGLPNKAQDENEPIPLEASPQ